MSERRTFPCRPAIAGSALLLVAALIVVPAAAGDRRGTMSLESFAFTAGPAQPSYRWLRRNIFSMCMYCHIAVPGIALGSLDDVRRLVVPGNPEASRLYIVVASKQMPKGRGGLPANEIAAIRQWILNGALDD